MNNKERIAYMIRRTKTTVAISSFLFLISSLIADLNMGGIYSVTGYSVTKMALGSLGIGLGFGLTCIIYTSEKLSRPVQISVHMLTGCTVMLAIAFLVGWIPTDRGLLPALLAILSMLLTAFVIAVLSYRRQKKLAERINRELEQKRG
jgi:peptidoglycan/LPS O-acetylase OafA/YrhL